MSFWKSPIDKPLDGSPDNAFVSDFQLIPNNTCALAMIKKFELINNEFGHYYQITWSLVDGAYKNANVRQKIAAFESDPQKKYRALNMLMLILKLCEFKPAHDNAPSELDLLPLVGKVLGIKVREWHQDGKSGNWVSEVHPRKDFKPEEGTKLTPVESAFSRNPKQTNNSLEDDIPF